MELPASVGTYDLLGDNRLKQLHQVVDLDARSTTDVVGRDHVDRQMLDLPLAAPPKQILANSSTERTFIIEAR